MVEEIILTSSISLTMLHQSLWGQRCCPNPFLRGSWHVCQRSNYHWLLDHIVVGWNVGVIHNTMGFIAQFSPVVVCCCIPCSHYVSGLLKGDWIPVPLMWRSYKYHHEQTSSHELFLFPPEPFPLQEWIGGRAMNKVIASLSHWHIMSRQMDADGLQ